MIIPKAMSVDCSIVLRFDTVDTETQYDSLTVYDGATADSTVLASYSGTFTDESLLMSSSNVVLVELVADESIEGAGFSASYAVECDALLMSGRSRTTPATLPRNATGRTALTHTLAIGGACVAAVVVAAIGMLLLVRSASSTSANTSAHTPVASE